jgi:hypothetical protein
METSKIIRYLAIGLFTILSGGSLSFAGEVDHQVGEMNSIETVIDDMKLPHESKPHGVPDSYDWSRGPTSHNFEEVDPSLLNKYHALDAWGQVYAAANGNPSKNTRVQIRNIKAYVLSRRDKKWHLAQSYQTVIGASWREDFVMEVNKPADIREERDGGGISVMVDKGFNFHFFTPQRAPFDPHDAMGIFTTVEARLVAHDSTRPDDRDQARLLLNMGCDLWEGLDNKLPRGQAAPAAGKGRFRLLSKNWQHFYMITLTDSQIRQYPPPVK